MGKIRIDSLTTIKGDPIRISIEEAIAEMMKSHELFTIRDLEKALMSTPPTTGK